MATGGGAEEDLFEDDGAEDDVASGKGMSKSLGLRLQKKMLGGMMKSKGAAKHFIDDESGALLDTLHQIAAKHSGDDKVAKKLLKDLVKIAVKVGLLYRHNQFNAAELAMGTDFNKKLKKTANTMMSYHEVAYTFDEEVLAEYFEECKDLMQAQIKRHLTAKSLARVEHVFSFFGDADMLTSLYEEAEYKDLRAAMCDGLDKIIEKL